MGEVTAEYMNVFCNPGIDDGIATPWIPLRCIQATHTSGKRQISE